MLNAPFEPLGHVTPDADHDVLRSLLGTVAMNRDNRDPTAIEVGTWVGSTARVLSEYCTVHCIDHFRGNEHDRLGELGHSEEHIFRTFCRNMGWRLFKTVFAHRGSSLLYASVWPFQVDLIFIDAEHTYEACKTDTEAWWPHLKAGGVMAWHDYDVFDGVTRAVDEFGKDGHHHCVAWKFKEPCHKFR